MNSFVNLDTSALQETGLIRISLNRPARRNALTRQMLHDLKEALEQVQQLSHARLLILQSTGTVFCAGMDLGEMQERAAAADKEQQWHKDSEIYCEVLELLFTLPIPTVAAIQGPVLAGGVGLVLACDLLLATKNVFFALPEPMRGITAAMVTPYLNFRVGAGVATQWLLSGERIVAQQALSSGLCIDVVAEDELDARLEKLSSNVLTGSPSALAITKRHLHDCADSKAVLDWARCSIDVSAVARQTDDAREGLAAFLEKRQPNWATNE